MEFRAKYFDELSTKELYEIIKARNEIFVVEQKILYQDLDDIDYKSLHCFIVENDKVRAYLRAFYIDDETVRLGRVLSIVHKKGLGRELITNSLEVIKEKMNFNKIYIEAQKHAIGFYEKFGFRVISDEFLDDGIIHKAMELMR